MGNKADVVKGLAKRCNENWSIAPKSDIVSRYTSYSSLEADYGSFRAFIFPTSKTILSL